MATPNYKVLTATERFALMIEAMAHGDEVDADRLEDTCPRHLYRTHDLEFRDRMRRAYGVAVSVCLNMRAGLGQVRMARAFEDKHEHFAAPVANLAKASFACGRAENPFADGEGKAAVVRNLGSDPQVRELLEEIEEVANDAVMEVAHTLRYAVGEAEAVNLLSQWEGFARFCRTRLALEPLTVTAAFGLGRDDPAAELAAAFPDATPDEAESARWAAQWVRGWDRRFGRPR